MANTCLEMPFPASNALPGLKQDRKKHKNVEIEWCSNSINIGSNILPQRAITTDQSTVKESPTFRGTLLFLECFKIPLKI